MTNQSATVFAGVPAINNALYHQLRFSVGDPACLICLPDGKRFLILRDIEMARARQKARADQVGCPADFAPDSGLSGDRETATAQSVAEFLVRHDIKSVVSDRTMPLIFADQIRQRGIDLVCDLDLGVTARREKDEEEIEWLRHAQSVTEGAIEYACNMIARAKPDGDGILQHDGAPLTSERVRSAVDIWLLGKEFNGPTYIIAGGSEGADCHNYGSGPLKTGEPVIVDIFPQDRKTRYNGDCTRTVVNGEPTDELKKMHAAVVAAKAAATAATRAGVTGEDVHNETIRLILEHGYLMGLPEEGAPPEFTSMPHGTGHGIGLDVHEPPLLDKGGPELVVGDALTIEPGLYSVKYGGVRVEDLVITQADGCINLNKLHEGLNWE
ncbi:MAG: M24 family metallopeptidase [Planctomycetota bacterium]